MKGFYGISIGELGSDIGFLRVGIIGFEPGPPVGPQMILDSLPGTKVIYPEFLGPFFRTTLAVPLV